MVGERRERRESLARRRAETHASGFETSTIRVPEGLKFFNPKVGVYEIDIVPYKVGKGNPMAPEGALYYERTYWIYKDIGPEGKWYVAIGKTFGKRDPIVDYKREQAREPDADLKALKALDPKERQLFLVYDREDPKAGLQLWDFSFHTFGKLLDSRVKNSREVDGWDLFYFPDDDGMTLRVTFEEGQGGKFIEAAAIDFLRRESPLPKPIVEHDICLDEMPIELTYDQLKSIFLCIDEKSGDAATSSHKSDRPADEDRSERRSTAREEERSQDTRREEPAPRERERAPEPETKSRPKTADEYGLAVKDEVIYKGEMCSIVKISPDGTSLVLLDSQDNPIRAVGCDEVRKLDAKRADPVDRKPAPPKDDPPFEKKEKATTPPSNSSLEDEDWDKDWR